MNAWSNVIRGVATGDGWGDLHEFASIEAITKNNPQGPDLPQRLRITDDTQMTLYLADALSETRDAPAEEVKIAILKAFLEYRTDPDNNRAPGNTVMSSLGKLSRILSARPGWTSTGIWQEATSKESDGSGTVMRTSPTAFLPEDRWVGVTAFAAAVTHGSANGIAAAILNAAILRGILAGSSKPGELVLDALLLADHAQEMGLLDVGEWLDGYQVDLAKGFRFMADILSQALKELPRLQANPWALKSDPSLKPAVDNGGWRAPHTLVIALLALDMLPGSPWQSLRRAVVTDGDSDTIGAVAGALVGAAYPEVFTKQWDDPRPTFHLRNRFEGRYARWIEEADEYEFGGAR